jgi:hypothetical protein
MSRSVGSRAPGELGRLLLASTAKREGKPSGAPKPTAAAAASSGKASSATSGGGKPSVASSGAPAPKPQASEAERARHKTCQLCHRAGLFEGSGSFFEVSLRGKTAYVHTNCARFSPLCRERPDGRIQGAAAEIGRGNRIVSSPIREPPRRLASEVE